MVMLLPMGVSLHHALLQHEDNICLAEGEQHVHEFHVDCDHDHFFSNAQALEQVKAYNLLAFFDRDGATGLSEGINDDPNLFLFDGRAPPSLTVSC